LLNASGSSDPDGDALIYKWYDGGTLIGEGALIDYVAPSAGDRALSVSVTDPAGLTTVSPTQTVNVQ
jgi:hypothetical protein